MVFKFLFEAAKNTADTTVSVGKAIFSHKDIATKAPTPEQLARMPKAPTHIFEIVDLAFLLQTINF